MGCTYLKHLSLLWRCSEWALQRTCVSEHGAWHWHRLPSALALLLGKRSSQGLCLCIPRKEWLMGLKAEPLGCLEMELWLKLNLSFCSVTDGQATVTNFWVIISCTDSSKLCTLLRYGCPVHTVWESDLILKIPIPFKEVLLNSPVGFSWTVFIQIDDSRE